MNQLLQWGAVLAAVVGLAIYGKVKGHKERRSSREERGGRRRDPRQEEMFDDSKKDREVAMAGVK